MFLFSAPHPENKNFTKNALGIFSFSWKNLKVFRSQRLPGVIQPPESSRPLTIDKCLDDPWPIDVGFRPHKKKHINHELQHPKPMRDPWEERYIYLDTYMKNHKNQLIKCIWSVSKNRNNPQIINSNRVFPHKPSILGAHPYFWKHPYVYMDP